MHSLPTFLVVAALGMLIAWLVTLPPELHHLRLIQAVVIPLLLEIFYYCVVSSGFPANVNGFITFVLIVATGFTLLPNITYFTSVRVTNFLDPMDWDPGEEEIALRPIRRLIDEDKNHQALSTLKDLLEKHNPTYEALLLKAKLLYHVGGVEDTSTALLAAIGHSHTTEQQLALMELLAALEEHQAPASRPPAAGSRRVNIQHELLLFPPGCKDRSLHKSIPPGSYTVGECRHGNHLWLKLAGEDWGNAAQCWEAVRKIPQSLAAPAPGKKGFFSRLSTSMRGKPLMQRQAEAQTLFKEACQYIREEDWPGARPLLQKASACDPDRYEIAYRLAQAVRRTADDATTAEAVEKILAQSQWTASEQQMLLQLKRPLSATKPC